VAEPRAAIKIRRPAPARRYAKRAPDRPVTELACLTRGGSPDGVKTEMSACHRNSVIRNFELKKKYSVWTLLLIYFVLSLTPYIIWTRAGLNAVTGDEPHYLVIASGILKYGSFEQTLPYKDEFLNHNIFRGSLAPEGAVPSPETTHAVQGPHGLFNVHMIGLPILLALPFFLGGVVGAKLFMIALNSIIIVVAWKISGVFCNKERWRLLAVSATCISIPLIPGSAQLYPDMVAGAISLSGLYWLLTTNKSRPLLKELAWFGALVFLPWLQVKFAATCAIIVSALVISRISEARSNSIIRMLSFVAIGGLSASLLLMYNQYAYGNMTGPYNSGALELSKTALMVFLGLHFDQNQGFLIQNPVALIGVISIGRLCRDNKKFTLILVLVYLSLIVPNALHPNWYGGWSFSGRFGWSAATVFYLPVIFGLLKLANVHEKAFQAIVGLSFVVQACDFYQYTFMGANLYNRPASALFVDSYSIFYYPMDRWLPMLYDAAWAYTYPPNYAWTVFVITLLLAGFFNVSKLNVAVRYALAAGLLVIIICGFLVRRQSHERVFYARDLPSLTGRVENVERIAERGVDRPGYLNFGPYVSLRKGTYDVLVRFSSFAPAEQVVGKFDIVESNPVTEIAELPLHGTGGHPQELEVAFKVTSWRFHAYEFRTYWDGLADVRIHEIVLRSF